jgi:hypothetical protein
MKELEASDRIVYGDAAVENSPGYDPISVGLALVQEVYWHNFAIHVAVGAYPYRRKGVNGAEAKALGDRERGWHYEKAGIRYICMLIGFIRDNLADAEQNMKSVIRLHREIMYGNGKLLLEHFAKEHPDAYAAKKFKEMTGTAEADKMWCSIYEFVNEALEPYSYCELEGIFNNSNNIDFRELGRKRTVLFVKGSDNDTSRRYRAACRRD